MSQEKYIGMDVHLIYGKLAYSTLPYALLRSGEGLRYKGLQLNWLEQSAHNALVPGWSD
jgi:hypothetical protein